MAKRLSNDSARWGEGGEGEGGDSEIDTEFRSWRFH